jgi:putative intracellular protease/amidase
VLEGTTATSHFADLRALKRGYPGTTWVAGRRYVDDGRITTTAGVTSGIAGSLHLVERFAGRAEAARIGREVGAADWHGSHGIAIPINTTGLQDYPYALGAALPWFKPTWGIALAPGSDEVDVAAAFEVYSGSSFAATLAPLAATSAVQTEHGMTLLAATPDELDGRVDRLIVPGADTRRLGPLLHWAETKSVPVYLPRHVDASESAFGPLVRDLGERTDRATAATLAKYIEYPIGRVPASASVPSRLILLSAALGLLGVATGALTWQLVNPYSRMWTALRWT